MRNAFSLIDLLVTLAIMAIVAAIALPRFAGSFERRALVNSAYRLTADFQRARGAAIDASGTVGVQFVEDSEQYEIGFDAGPLAGKSERVSLAESPLGAVVASVSGAYRNRVVFTGYGDAVLDSTVVLGRGKLRIPVVIAAAGGSATTGTIGAASTSIGVTIGGVTVGGVAVGGTLSVGAGGVDISGVEEER